MDQDLAVLFAPRSIELSRLAEAARETFAKAHPETLELHVADESCGAAGLARHVKQFTAVSLWSDDGSFAWDEFGRVLSRAVPGRLLALVVAEQGGMIGYQLVSKGELGDPCPSDDDDVNALVRQAFEEAYVVALSEEEAEGVVEALATGARRGICLFSKRPETVAGQHLGPVELERSRNELACCLLDLPDAGPPSGPGPATLLGEYLRIHNAGIASGSWGELASLLAPEATLDFEGAAIGPFRGAAAVLQAFRDKPPTEPIQLIETREEKVEIDGATVTAPYAAKNQPWRVLGTIRLEVEDGKIRRLAISVRD